MTDAATRGAATVRRARSTRMATSIALLAGLIVALLAGAGVFTVAVAALAGWASLDFVRRLDRSAPLPAGVVLGAEVEAAPPAETTDPPAAPDTVAAVPPPFVAVAAVLASLGAGIRIRGSLSLLPGLVLGLLVLLGWGLTRAGRPGVAAALGRAAVVVSICGFGAGHAVMLRAQEQGIRLALFLLVSVAAYETVAMIFEMATVQVRPGHNRQAPVAGVVLLFVVGLVFGSVANPPITYGAGIVMALSAAASAAAGRAIPALFADPHRDGGLEPAAITSALFTTAPVVYYVARVVI